MIALGDQVGVELRYWSAWNEPNHPFFISPQRATCSTSAKSLAVTRYAELVRNLKRALDDAPGDQEYVLGELAGLDESKTKSTSIREFLRALPRGIVCGSTILSQHGYITGINPVDDAAKGAATHHCKKKHVVWMTETGVGAPHAGQDKRTTAPAERRACRQLHRRLVQWYDDPRVTAAFQYTFREDDVFRTGLVTTSLDRAFPVLKEWQAWGGTRAPEADGPAALTRALRDLLAPRLRQQPQREAREADHDRQHPVLRAHRELRVGIEHERAVVGEHERGDVPEHDEADLQVPGRVLAQQAVVDRRRRPSRTGPSPRRAGRRRGRRSTAPRRAGTSGSARRRRPSRSARACG